MVVDNVLVLENCGRKPVVRIQMNWAKEGALWKGFEGIANVSSNNIDTNITERYHMNHHL